MQHLTQVFNIKKLDDYITQYEDHQGLSYLSINSALSTATIALQGAHIMHWQPQSSPQKVLWLSSQSRFEQGRSIRGGIPICWPWFGAHHTHSDFCTHGFARVIPWTLIKYAVLQNGAVQIHLEMQSTESAKRQLSYPFRLRLRVTIGETLHLAMTTKNIADHPFLIGEAFHTYFAVSDIENISVSGLDNLVYSDKVNNYRREIQHGKIQFNDEFDRVYLNSRGDCTIKDSEFNRSIRISKSCSNTTIIWTPWQDKADKLPDIGENEWRKMICLESGNAMENSVVIYPDEKHTLAVEYQVESL